MLANFQIIYWGSNNNSLSIVNDMPADMSLKLKFDYLVNMPILMRAIFKNVENPKLALTMEQRKTIAKYKIETMDAIESVMIESHNLSKQLKDDLLYGTLSDDEGFALSKKIAEKKEQVLNMKIMCINFIKKTISKEQFNTLIELDRKMLYLNSPYNY